MNFLSNNFTLNERFTIIKPVTDLATGMLTHLFIAGKTLHVVFVGLEARSRS
jgi:hypothetical protein